MPLEDLVRLLLEDDVEIPGRGAPEPFMPPPAQGHVVALHDTGRDLHDDRLLPFDQPVAPALLAGILHDPSLAAAARTRRDIDDLSEERALDLPDLPRPIALRAGHDGAPGFGPLPAAMGTGHPLLDANLLLDPRRNLLQRQLQPDLDIRSTGVARAREHVLVAERRIRRSRTPA